MPCESSINRGARGDSSFMLDAMASSSEKPPLQMRSIKWWEYVTPGFTSYPHRIQYQTYDVTESIRPGKNRLEILAAGGWATANMLVRPLALFCGKVLTYPQFLL